MNHIIRISDAYLKKKYESLFCCELFINDVLLRTTETLEEDLVFQSEILGNFYKIKTEVKTSCSDSNFTLSDFNINGSSKPVMGILNVTPDSFSDGGKYNYLEDAVAHAEELITDGAEIIDIGGESTRPGAEKVNSNEELQRVLPVINRIREKNKEILISIDTYKSDVAEEAIKNGANIINDISGGTFDSRMFEIAFKYDVPIILMHIKGTPENMQKNPVYTDVISEIFDYFKERIKSAQKCGIKKIILDPGIGFGKTVQNNFEIIKRFSEFKQLGFPLLMGLSRKSFLGKSLNLETDQRENSTSISEFYSLLNGADIIRTHNVKTTIEAVKLFNFYNNPDLLLNV